jgi:multidrug efflux pump subunit AcrA (membrane-fusion protein)
MHQAMSRVRAFVACAALVGLTGPLVSQQPVASVPEHRSLDAALTDQFGVRCVSRAKADSIMGFEQPTRIVQVLARGGQEVTKGQLLIQGDEGEEAALLRVQKVRAESTVPVEAAKAEMDQAEHEAEMQRQARVKGGSSEPEVRRAELLATVKRYQYLNAVLSQTQEAIQLERMTARVAKYRLEAPYDGVVDTVQGDVGQSVGDNEKIIRVVNIDTIWIDVGARTDDPRTLSLKEGDPAWVLFDVAGAAVTRPAKVIEVAPTIDMASRTTRVRVEVANPKGEGRLKPGGPAWVRFTPPPQELLQKLAPAPVPPGAQANAASRN